MTDTYVLTLWTSAYMISDQYLFDLFYNSMAEEEDLVYEVHEIVVQRVGHVPVAKGDFNHLPKKVKIFVAHCVSTILYQIYSTHIRFPDLLFLILSHNIVSLFLY